MTAILLTELEEAGVHLSLAGVDLRYQTRPGVRIDSYKERISSVKKELITELLRREIVAAVDVEPEDFDRPHYDDLWSRYCALPVSQPITATTPPPGWNGQLCSECQWPGLCKVLGPRGPHLPNGPCPAYPIELALEAS